MQQPAPPPNYINLARVAMWLGRATHACMRAAAVYSTMAVDDDVLLAAAPVRKGPWTMEEDHVLVSYVAAHGEGSWNYLARAAGLSRTGKSCRLRWLNYLRPDLRRGKMTPEEQDLVVYLHSQWGNKWSKIAKHLPGRTDNEVKNFWRTKIQEKKKQKRRQPQPRKDDGGSGGAIIAVVAAAGLCSSVDNDGGAPAATTEGQGSSSTTTTTTTATTTGVDDDWFVTRDYGIVAHQPSMLCGVEDDGHLGDHRQQVHGGAAAGPGGTSWTAAAAAMDDFFLPELLAASGENFWAIDDFWSTTQSSRLGNNDS